MKRPSILTKSRSHCLPVYALRFLQDCISSTRTAVNKNLWKPFLIAWYFDGLFNAICSIVRSCVTCQRAKVDAHFKGSALHPQRVGRLFQRWTIDVCKIDRPNSKGQTLILTAVEQLSGWIEAWPLDNEKAETIAEVLFNQLVLKWGIPSSWLSDRGLAFMSRCMTHLAKLCNVKQLRTSAYTPASMGRTNRVTRASSPAFAARFWTTQRCPGMLRLARYSQVFIPARPLRPVFLHFTSLRDNQ